MTFAVKAVGKDLAYQWYFMRPEGSWKKVAAASYNTAALVITANTKTTELSSGAVLQMALVIFLFHRQQH